MGTASDKLSDLIAEIWDRSHHIFKTVGAQKVLRWLMHSDDLEMEETEVFGTDEIPYPAEWAPETGYDDTKHIRWAVGVWAPGGAGAFTTDAVIEGPPWDSFTADAYLLMGFRVDSSIFGLQSSSISADANIYYGMSASLVADANIFSSGQDTFTADANVEISSSDTFSADSDIELQQSSSITADANIETTESPSITSDAVIEKGESSDITADSDIETTESSSITSDADIEVANSDSITADSYIEEP